MLLYITTLANSNPVDVADASCDSTSLLQLHSVKSTLVTERIAVNQTENPCTSCGCAFVGRDGKPTNCDIEINSRAMVEKWMPENATVLEVGARYGSVSCAIATKLKQSGKQVSVDADHRVWDSLEKNRVSNGCNFHTVHGLLGKKDGAIMEDGFGTFAASAQDFNNSYAAGKADSKAVAIPHFTLSQVENSHALQFDAANFDCEGCAAFVFQDFPELKTQLNLLIMESHNEAEEKLFNELLSSGWEVLESISRQRVLRNTRNLPRMPL